MAQGFSLFCTERFSEVGSTFRRVGGVLALPISASVSPVEEALEDVLG